MKNGTLFIEVFNADDFSVEYREELHVSANMLQMKLTAGMRGADYVLLDDYTDKEKGKKFLRVRVVKENKNWDPHGPKDDPKNYRSWNIAKFELDVFSSKGLVKGQTLLRDDRLVRVSFIPD